MLMECVDCDSQNCGGECREFDFCKVCRVWGCVCELCQECCVNDNPYTHKCHPYALKNMQVIREVTGFARMLCPTSNCMWVANVEEMMIMRLECDSCKKESK